MLKRLLITGIVIALGTGLVIGYFHVAGKPRSSGPNQARIDTVLDQFAARGPDYADPAYCVECHQDITTEWEQSDHALANAPLTRVDRRRLLQHPTAFLQQRGMKWLQKKGHIWLNETGIPEYPVIGTIGTTPLIQYLHLSPDGRIQTHDVAWDVAEKEWFSVFEGEDTEPRIHGEWGHWTGQGMNWDANCAYCHMTEYRKQYDPGSNSYKREWTHMAITCAQCHPNMEVHLSQIRNGNEEYKETLSPVQVMEYCATCHARREQLTPDTFVPGDRFEDHFSLTLADIPGVYHPDGQVIGENYVYGSFTMSKMGHKGITCLDCHDPHTTGHILPFENNALCMRCHGSGLKDAPKIDPLAHSHHKPDSPGNRCVECHMPVSTFMGRDGRRDHSFSHPDPQLTRDLGIPNACTGCHNTQSVEWSLEYATDWYGEDMNADRREKAHLMADLFNGKADTGARLRDAIQKEENRYWKATLISMMRYAPLEQENYNLVHENLTHADPLVRAAAVRTVGLDSLDKAMKQELLNDPLRIVRIAASLSSSALETASAAFDQEFEAYSRHTADSPVGSLRYGAYWLARGDLEKAEHSIRLATSFEPTNPEVWRLAAIQLYQLGDTESSRDYFRKALELSPENPAVLFNMGLLAYEQGDVESALNSLNRAVRADPSFEDAWYNLIALYWSLELIPAARERLAEALQSNPQSQRLQQLSLSLQSLE